MDELQRLVIERDCSRLQTQYTHFADFGERERIADLFTPDGVFELVSGRLNGRAAIRAALAPAEQSGAQPLSRHVCSNQLITVIDKDNATGLAYFTYYRGEDAGDGSRATAAPAVLGVYRDLFVRTGEGWRIARRQAEVAMEQRP